MRRKDIYDIKTTFRLKNIDHDIEQNIPREDIDKLIKLLPEIDWSEVNNGRDDIQYVQGEVCRSEGDDTE